MRGAEPDTIAPRLMVLNGGSPDLVWQRTANASRAFWSRTLASHAGPAKTVVGSGKRLRRRRPGGKYGVGRTDTSDFSAPRGRHHCRDMWIHRVSRCAEEQPTRTRVLPFGLSLWIIASPILRRRRRGLNVLGAVTRCADVRPLTAWIRHGAGCFAVQAPTFAASLVRLRLWPPQWRRQMNRRLPLERARLLTGSAPKLRLRP